MTKSKYVFWTNLLLIFLLIDIIWSFCISQVAGILLLAAILITFVIFILAKQYVESLHNQDKTSE